MYAASKTVSIGDRHIRPLFVTTLGPVGRQRLDLRQLLLTSQEPATGMTLVLLASGTGLTPWCWGSRRPAARSSRSSGVPPARPVRCRRPRWPTRWLRSPPHVRQRRARPGRARGDATAPAACATATWPAFDARAGQSHRPCSSPPPRPCPWVGG